MKIILLGQPGAGKSTQAKLLKEKFKIPYFSREEIMEMICEEIVRDTEMGKAAAKIMREGGSIPDPIMMPILISRLKQEDCKNGYILDGFPHTSIQAQALEKDNIKFDVVIILQIPERDEIVRRLITRNHKDDTMANVSKRLELYNSETQGVIYYYKELRKSAILWIKGKQNTDSVFDSISSFIVSSFPKSDIAERSDIKFKIKFNI